MLKKDGRSEVLKEDLTDAELQEAGYTSAFVYRPVCMQPLWLQDFVCCVY